jgi:hypothetical protein
MMQADGFDWSLVHWAAPKTLPNGICAYCGGRIPPAHTAFMVFRTDDCTACFCASCELRLKDDGGLGAW